jgi:hypothetical protein
VWIRVYDTLTSLPRAYVQTTVAGGCDGFIAQDLLTLLHRARINSITRCVSVGGVDTGVVLNDRDIAEALDGFVPAGLRGVKLFQGSVEWDHVGGLREAKRVLKETLQFPIRYDYPVVLRTAATVLVLTTRVAVQVLGAVRHIATEAAVGCSFVWTTGLWEDDGASPRTLSRTLSLSLLLR